MANIDIKLSQAVINLESTSAFGDGPFGSLADVADAMYGAQYAIDTTYTAFSSWSLVGTTLTLNFPDGVTRTYTGVTRADPNALKGTAVATGYVFHKGVAANLSESGVFNFNYEMVPSASGYGLSISKGTVPSQTTALKLATTLAASDPLYHAAIGNVTGTLAGSVISDANNNFSGNVTKVSVITDQMVSSISIDGNFTMSGNIVAIGTGASSTAIAGTMTGYSELYRDGSHSIVTKVAKELTSHQVIDASLLADAANFGGDDMISLDLPGTLYHDYLMAAGAGNDNITLRGGGGRMNLDAGSGNDKIMIMSDGHKVDGGAGIDSVAVGSIRGDYTIQHTADGFVVTDKAGAVNTLLNVERLDFADAHVALDVAGNAGQVYRTYQAAFNRAPDAGGLGFWIHFMDGGMTLPQIAQGFMASDEFKTMYGNDPTRLDFVNKLYSNVLHRPGEATGVQFWLDALNNPAISYSSVLAAFAESAENQAALIGVISNGFGYVPFTG